MDNSMRIEKDSMGKVEVCVDALWGAQTQRAIDNFSVSPYRISDPMLKALILIKREAAGSNSDLGILNATEANAIIKAADEVLEGKHLEHFPLDVFQTGSGTSWNMNVNEVLANRANEILNQDSQKEVKFIHPNDHVNKGQSSNDVIPSAINISARIQAQSCAMAFDQLGKSINKKENEFQDILKLGRTHLQDAVPMRLSQELSAWRTQIQKSAARIRSSFASLEELALGGTAIGSGLNCKEEFASCVIESIAKKTQIPFRQADNLFEAISARDSNLELMNALHSGAVALMKIGQDLRLLSSGPRSGLGEINLPSLQPGSSIMPGKVNPVIPEMMIQAAAFVMGKHQSVTIACQNSPLQLNIMMPLISHELYSSMDILINTIDALDKRCLAGITVNVDICREKIDWSLAVVTPLALNLGYDKAAEIAYLAWQERIKVRDAALKLTDLSETDIDEILDITKMI